MNRIKWNIVDENDEYKYIDLSSLDINSHSITNTVEITRSSAPSRAQQIVKTGDLLFGTTRPMLKRYGIVNEDCDSQICSTGYCVIRADKNKVLPKWIYYIISTEKFFGFVKNNQRGASYPSISDNKVKSYIIPLPSLKEQERIVSLLDKFDAYCNDLTQGIPAEIEARKKQYEYYRDKLLTFKRLEK